MPGPSLFATDLLLTDRERGIEQADGCTVVDLFTKDDATYHIMIRESTSVCLYLTRPGSGMHSIVYDSLDNKEPDQQTRQILRRLSWMRTAIDMLLVHVEPTKE